MQTIAQMLSEVRRRAPEATAVAYRGARLTFAELDAAARRAARGLSELGVGHGDRVALWLPNTPAYLVLWLGAARLGAITVAVNTRFRAIEVADIVRRSRAKVLALWPGFRGIPFLDILGEIDRNALECLETLVVYEEAERDEAGGGTGTAAASPALPASLAHCRRVAFPDLLERPPLDEDRAAPGDGSNMFTTSGTTRAPKFVLHSHASITAHALTMARALGYAAEPGGGVLGMLPLCGVFGFCQTTAALAAGSTLALASAFDAAEAVRLVDEHRVRCLNVTDDMVLAMFDATAREVALPTVEACGYAAFTAKPDELLARAEARSLPLVGLYGMSEVQAFFSRQPLDAAPERRLLGGGIPLDPAGRVRVRDPESGRLLAVGEAGEIEIAGPSLMREYVENPAATRETVSDDGFIRSGDLGHLTGRRRVRLPRTDGGRDAARRVPRKPGRDRGPPQRAPGGARRAGRRGGYGARPAPRRLRDRGRERRLRRGGAPRPLRAVPRPLQGTREDLRGGRVPHHQKRERNEDPAGRAPPHGRGPPRLNPDALRVAPLHVTGMPVNAPSRGRSRAPTEHQAILLRRSRCHRIGRWNVRTSTSRSSRGSRRRWLRARRSSRHTSSDSHARGEARPDSDIDVAVYIDEALADDGHWGYRAELTTDLMAALGTNDIDVVVLNEAPILLYHRVLRDGVRVLSRDLRATTTRAGQALSFYFDFLPQLDKMDAARRYAAGTDRS